MVSSKLAKVAILLMLRNLSAITRSFRSSSNKVGKKKVLTVKMPNVDVHRVA